MDDTQDVVLRCVCTRLFGMKRMVNGSFVSFVRWKLFFWGEGIVEGYTFSETNSLHLEFDASHILGMLLMNNNAKTLPHTA